MAAADVRNRLQERAFAPVFDETLALQRMGRRAEPLNCVAAIDWEIAVLVAFHRGGKAVPAAPPRCVAASFTTHVVLPVRGIERMVLYLKLNLNTEAVIDDSNDWSGCNRESRHLRVLLFTDLIFCVRCLLGFGLVFPWLLQRGVIMV